MSLKFTLMPLTFLAGMVALTQAAEPAAERPPVLREQILLKGSDFAQQKEMAYLAFPDVERLNDREILVSYKRGRSHARDLGAILEAIRFDTETNTIEWRRTLGGQSDLIFQMGEWIRFPDGRLGNFVDVQKVEIDGGAERHHRVGVYWTMSDDDGKTFSAMKKLGPVDGVEYGYMFDGAIAGNEVFMLAMSFPELSARKTAYDDSGKRIYGEVSVISSKDQGDTWKHVRNLSHEFGGIDINESALIPFGDGFLVATRGYDSKARLHRVDRQFRVVQERNLTDDSAVIGSHVGRPRLFVRDGGLYLIGRNSRGGPMELALFRLDPQKFDLERFVVLDPANGAEIKDGYYAVPYFQQTSEGTLFNVITYRRPGDQSNPDIVRLEFRWDDVR